MVELELETPTSFVDETTAAESEPDTEPLAAEAIDLEPMVEPALEAPTELVGEAITAEPEPVVEPMVEPEVEAEFVAEPLAAETIEIEQIVEPLAGDAAAADAATMAAQATDVEQMAAAIDEPTLEQDLDATLAPDGESPELAAFESLEIDTDFDETAAEVAASASSVAQPDEPETPAVESDDYRSGRRFAAG